jgi:hypothetical protein
LATFSVDWADVVLPILRGWLPGVNVMSSVPDGVPNFVPLVVVRRTGGSSDHPWLYDQPWLMFQHWAGPEPGGDARRNANNLADAVRRALWEAWDTQQVTLHGWLTKVRESSAPEEINDPDVPMLVRLQATYEIQIRRNKDMP